VLKFEEQGFVPEQSLRTYISTKAPLINTQGEVYAVCGIATDISELKHTEAELRESAERERTVLKIVEKIRETFDLEEIFANTTEKLRETLKCHRLALYRFNPDWSGEFVAESVVSDCMPLMGSNLQTEWQDTCLQATQGGRYQNHETYAVHDITKANLSDCHRAMYERIAAESFCITSVFQGDRLWGLLAAYHNGAPHQWKEGEISLLTQTGIQLGISLAQVDLFTQIQHQSQQLQQAKEAAEAANQAKSAFIAHTSHELRTPLNAILGFAQILQRESVDPATNKRGIEVIRQSGQHLLTLINDILYIAKIEAGKLNLELRDFVFPSFLDDLAAIIRVRCQQKAIAFEHQNLSDLPHIIKGDETRLRQLLLNLLSNAVKFTAQGKVTFKVGYVKDFPPAETNPDNPESLEQIRFFDLHFPVVNSAINVALNQDLKQDIIGYQGRKQQILVVDDLDNNREIIANFLTPLGFEIIEANGGQTAIALTQKHQPDLVLLDRIMPAIDGWQVIQHLRQESQFQALPIIIISASTLTTDESHSYHLGASGFLAKPLDFEQLLRVIEHHLDLEWITVNGNRRSLISPSCITPQNSPTPTLVIPGEQQLAQLNKLIMEGNIRDCISYVASLKQQPELNPFVEQVTQLAESCQLRKLKNFMQQYK